MAQRRMVDHPEVDRRFQASRGAEDTLSAAQREAVARGEGAELGEDALARLKVFDAEDNQLGIADVEKAEVPCISCAGVGLYSHAEMKIPNFGLASLISFVCMNASCGFTYRKVRAVAPERDGVDDLPDGFGRRITLSVRTEADFNREVVLAGEAFLRAGEIELFNSEGVMSTVEGLLRQVAVKLRFMCTVNDGAEASDHGKHVDALIDGMINGVREGQAFDFVIEDESDASHIQTFDGDEQVKYEAYSLDSDAEDGNAEQSSGEPGQGIGGSNLDTSHAPECNDPSCEGCWLPSASELAAAVHNFAAPVASQSEAEQQQARELNEYLAKFAEHVEAQEGRLAGSASKQAENREQVERASHAFLDEMD